MVTATAQSFPTLRTLLVLGRVSNLPTVWSNCLAGWLLSGGSGRYLFVLLCLGATFFYLGGMFLNDAFDEDFDRQHRPERPIPSRAISASAVWQWGFGWLGLGVLCFAFLGNMTAVLGILLGASILIYDAIHKIFAFSPIFMAGCRFFLFLAAASIGYDGITGLTLWSALALALYIIGLSFIARRESMPDQDPTRVWPAVLLLAPILLATIVNRGEWQGRGYVLCAMLLAWIVFCLTFIYWPAQRSIGRGVSLLLAGIVLVDFLAVAGGGALPMALTFAVLFALALVFQRFIPAT